jgi:molybdate transport system substrate-binding protein
MQVSNEYTRASHGKPLTVAHTLLRGFPFVVLFLLCLLGCLSNTATTPTVREVHVAAAANLKFAFDDFLTEFRKQHPDIQVKVTYGSSGNFFAQLSNKAPFDVFLSADTEYPAKLVEQGLAAREDMFKYAVGKLVVWVPKDSSLDVERLGLKALADASVKKVAIANPRHAPYGRAAEAALKHQGAYAEVHEKLILGDNVEQTSQFAHSGNAQAGIIPLSLALNPTMREAGNHWLVPQEAYPVIEQAGVILPQASDRDAAAKMRAFLLGIEGRGILQRYGYGNPVE